MKKIVILIMWEVNTLVFEKTCGNEKSIQKSVIKPQRKRWITLLCVPEVNVFHSGEGSLGALLGYEIL